jgi:hypothetical protein
LDEFGNKIRRSSRRLSQWNSHPQKIFRIHVIKQLEARFVAPKQSEGGRDGENLWCS